MVSAVSLIHCATVCVASLDLKLHLAGSDYGNFLANESSPLAVATIDDKLRERLVIEFRHLRNQAMKPLSDFMDYIMLVLSLNLLCNHINHVYISQVLLHD